MSVQSVDEITDGFGKLSVDKSMEELPGESSSSFQFEKICVAALYSNSQTLDYKRLFYIIDMSNYYDSASIIRPLEHVFEVVHHEFQSAAIVVLGTTLYLFGGLDRFNSTRTTLNGLVGFCPYWVNDVFSYDMKDAIPSKLSKSQKRRIRQNKNKIKAAPNPKTTTQLDRTCMFEEIKMSGKKQYPAAVIIDDFRICVFTTILYECEEYGYMPHEPTSSTPSFELFDTRTRTWTVLPEPMDYSSKSLEVPIRIPEQTILIIEYYTQCSTLIVSTNVGFYCMNFGLEDLIWEEMAVPNPYVGGDFPSCYGVSVMIMGDLLCTPFEVRKWGDFWNKYPIQFRERGGGMTIDSGTGSLCVEDRDVCIVRAGFEFWGTKFFLLIDIVKFHDLHPELMTANPYEVVKSLTFALKSLPYRLITLDVFPIKG